MSASKPAKINGQWFVLAAAVLWGTTGTAQAFAPTGARPLAVGAMRLAIGGGALLVMAVARGVWNGNGRWPAMPTALAAMGMAAYQPFFFAAVSRTGVAIGTIAAIGSAPIWAGLLGWIMQGERPGRRWAMATLLAITGCGLVVVTGERIHVDAGGVGLALGAGGAYAVYALSSKRLLETHPPDAVTAVVFGLAALILSPLLFTADLQWLAHPRGLVVALHLGLVATAAAYILFTRGLRTVATATAVTLSLAEPLTATLLGVFLLGERLTTTATIGVGLILGGLALLSFRSSQLEL